jgi:predicted chitinase
MTIAGQRESGFGGDGGPAVRAFLGEPSALTTDARGDLFIIDDQNERVREVTATGKILTFAGTGIVGDDGDGGLATQATFEFGDPIGAAGGGLAVDRQGDLFIADPDKGRVREVTPDGIIHPFAGGGDSFLGDGGPATQASLIEPYAVAVDSKGDVFICDSGTSAIREVTPDGMIHTVVGVPPQAIGGPGGFSGDGGPASQAQLNEPSDILFDGKGDLFIVDSGNNRIREVTTDGIIHTIAGGGTSGFSMNGVPATSAKLNLDNEGGIAIDANGSLFITDSGDNVVREVTNGIITTVAGNGTMGYSGNGGPATRATLSNPVGVAVSSTGELFIADTYNNVIRKVTGVAAAVTLQLTATINSSTQLTVGFNSFPGASNYILSMVQSNAAPTTVSPSKFTVISSIAQPSGNVVSNLQPDTIYLYRVVASLASGKTTTAFLQVETAESAQASVQVTATMLRNLAASVSPARLPSIATLTTYADALNNHLAAYSINTPARVAAFLAQAAEETNGFRTLTAASGGTFRSRGFLMISGQTNYSQISMDLYGDQRLVSNPSMMSQPDVAALVSAFYWGSYSSNGQNNTLADQLSVSAFAQITTAIQGPGTEMKREQYYQHALKVIYLGMQPGETLNAVNGTAASTLSALLGTLNDPSNKLGSTVTLTITLSGHKFNRVVIVGEVLSGGKT